MDAYRTEEEQVEALKKWWQENGKSIVAGIVIGIVAIFGWRGWNNHQVQQAESASLLYEQMIAASRNDDMENIKIYADRIVNEYDKSSYAIFAKLMLARLATEDNQLDQAESQLRQILQTNKIPEIEHIARLRLARVLMAGGKLDEANKQLQHAPGKFQARYEELRGDILLKQGDKEGARKAYEKALINAVAAGDSQRVLEMKLDDLGRS